MLVGFSIVFLILGILTCVWIGLDVAKRPQHMHVMNITWPMTGLYLPIIGGLLYLYIGRAPLGGEHHHDHMHMYHHSSMTTSKDHDHAAMHHSQSHGHMHHEASHSAGSREHQHDHAHMHHHGHEGKPLWKSALVDNTHCGGGCTLGDIIAGPIAQATAFSIAGSHVLGHFVLSFVGAFIVGIAFQYLPKREMNPSMSRGKALVEALKADTFSVICYQIGMYIWLLICIYGFGMTLNAFSFPYWFMMQIAMLCGFVTVYPANLILIKRGIKEAM